MLEDDQSNLDDATTHVEPPRDDAAPAIPKRRRKPLDRSTVSLGALVVLAAGGLFFMHWKTAASIAVITDADANDASVQTLLTGGRQGLVNLSRDIERTRQTIDAIAHRDSAILASAKPLTRDPFSFQSLDPQQVGNGPAGTNQAAREAARNKALAAAKALQLQSIMYGTARRSCLVDGKLYFEGQPLGDFTIGRISPGAITIQTGEFTFELRLRK